MPAQQAAVSWKRDLRDSTHRNTVPESQSALDQTEERRALLMEKSPSLGLTRGAVRHPDVGRGRGQKGRERRVTIVRRTRRQETGLLFDRREEAVASGDTVDNTPHSVGSAGRHRKIQERA